MRKILIALLLLAGCGGGEEQENQVVPAPTKADPPDGDATLATLTGLYEGDAERPDQLCIIEGAGRDSRFGLLVWGANDHSCSGSGTVSRRGDNLRFTMLGDSSCTIEAPISGATVTLPATLPQGCAYYCGARASMGGASFTQQGTTEADALKARDLVGDSLCGG